jgi:hypothetical protein
MQKTYHCFDWDDNLIFMPTNIVIFNKENDTEEVVLSTENFASHRGDIGKDKEFLLLNNKISENGKGSVRNFKDYIIIGDGEHPTLNSFREFRDCKEEFFIKHLKKAIDNKKFGPEWELFLKVTKNSGEARNVYIVTARGHSAHTIYMGIKYLKELGLIENHVPRKNIYPVSHEKFKGNSSNPQSTKLKILKTVFKEANELAKTDQVHHTVYFSDDDLKTINHLKEKVSRLRLSSINYWKNIHIRLRYTGNKKIKKELMIL